MNEIKLPELPSWTAKYVIPANDDLSGAQFLDDALIAYARSAVEAATAPLGDRIASLEAALHEWFDKTEWVQQTCRPKELGLHRADILKARIAELEGAVTQLCEQAAAGTPRHWREVLGFGPDWSGNSIAVNEAYRRLAARCHHDKGGTHAQMEELNRARDEALGGVGP